MKLNKIESIILQLESNLNVKELERLENLEKIQQSFSLCLESYSKVKHIIINEDFEHQKDEIIFFKFLKPRIYSLQIYLHKLYNIITKFPPGTKNSQLEYLKLELDKIDHYIINNGEFCKYYVAGFTHLDHHYFTRGNHLIELDLDYHFFDQDDRVSSSHDYKASRILANKMIKDYVEHRITMITNEEPVYQNILPNLTWNKSKIDLIELIYAFHTSNSITNNISEISTIFSRLFDLELGNVYEGLSRIKLRKKEKIKFLPLLIDSYLEFLENEDN